MAETLQIRSSDDVVRVRQRVRLFAVEAGMTLVDQTKIVTAASELARNTLDYGVGAHRQRAMRTRVPWPGHDSTWNSLDRRLAPPRPRPRPLPVV